MRRVCCKIARRLRRAAATDFRRGTSTFIRRARGRIGASVQAVEHGIGIGIARATAGIHGRAEGRVGAPVEPIQHHVAIAIARAAALIHAGAAGRIRAAIAAIGDAVHIGIPRRPAERENGKSHVGAEMKCVVGGGRETGGRVIRTASLEAECHSTADGQALADQEHRPTVGIGGALAVQRAFVAGAEVQPEHLHVDQQGAAGTGGPHAVAGGGGRLGEIALSLEGERAIKEEPESSAPAIARIQSGGGARGPAGPCAKGAEFDLSAPAALGGERQGRREGGRDKDDAVRAHSPLI